MPSPLTSFTACLAAFGPVAHAVFTPEGDSPSGNAIYTPALHAVVTVGSAFSITWDPTTSGNVSLQLCHGPSTDCVITKTIADNIVNSGNFSWTPTTDLEPSTTTGYGIELVAEDGTYQYSDQFGISNDDYSGSSSSSFSTASSSATSSVAAAGDAAATSASSSSKASSNATSASSAASTTGSGSNSSSVSYHHGTGIVASTGGYYGYANATTLKATSSVTTSSSRPTTTETTTVSDSGSSASGSTTSSATSTSSSGAAASLRASLGGLAAFAGAAIFAL